MTSTQELGSSNGGNLRVHGFLPYQLLGTVFIFLPLAPEAQFASKLPDYL